MTGRSLADHRAALLADFARIGAIEVLVADSGGSVLAEDLVADVDLPPAPIATCDGYAVLAADVASASAEAPVTLAVSHDVTWESRVSQRHVPGTSARIGSGAPLPTGADAVVPRADTDGGVAKVAVTAAVREGANVRPAGADAKAGQPVLAAGTRLGPRQLALAAAMGRRRLSVHPTPRVVVLAVGNELIEPGAERGRTGVPEANSHALARLATAAGASAYRVGVVSDDRIALRETIEDQLVRADLVITTGGLSGAHGDSLPDVLAELGDYESFELAMTPGRRHGHGRVSLGGDDTTPVIALPGHPPAAIVAFEMYVWPVVRTMSGYDTIDRPRVQARAAEGWAGVPGAVQCVPVRLSGASNLEAAPLGDPREPSLADLAAADGLAVVPENVADVAAGATVDCIDWRY